MRHRQELKTKFWSYKKLDCNIELKKKEIAKYFIVSK